MALPYSLSQSKSMEFYIHPQTKIDSCTRLYLLPQEYTLYENNAKQYVDVIFGRDGVFKPVKSFTFKLAVDLRYDKKAGTQIIG